MRDCQQVRRVGGVELAQPLQPVIETGEVESG
jgi:hypothetical protein